jgi:hypothetical protein
VEKFLKMLLIEGWNLLDGDKKGQDQYIKEFEYMVNTQVLGTQYRHSNWRLVLGRDKDNNMIIGDQAMPNTHARKFIDKFELLSSFCLQDSEEDMAKWNAPIIVWRELMIMARQKEDFSDEEIEEFTDLCDDFYEKWLEVKGRDGLTNYIHMVGSGHMSYYLRKWRNLYRYSQQGWESLNAQIKAFFSQNSKGRTRWGFQCPQ